MNRILINLPFIAVFFAAAYWPDSRFLDNLAVAVAVFVICLSAVASVTLICPSEAAVAKTSARVYPNGKGRTLSAVLAGLMAVGLIAWGHPVAAAVYSMAAAFSWAVLSPREK